MKRIVTLIIVVSTLFSATTYAQLEIGASYELRDEDPQSGFGVRIEKGFLEQLPLVKISMRAHFSFFNDENQVDEGGLTYSQDLTNYDFGLAFIAGISVGLIEPYVGLGLGSTTLEVKNDFSSSLPGVGPMEDQNESNIYWNGFLGAKVSIIPMIKPFVEYRYSDTSLSEPEVAEVRTGRIIFGVMLSF
ncbi:MAG: outer membrane beta-barrel protein [Balneolaceae bacterium]|nr:outer membrane beta-barrel protein [Balneolaceae bacterium]MBO6544869.1 outer membrane beta-barrel protein [Balneolaceae bacterium]MBO6646265.1 outer membrane beta-barrel protein [Balneolaceae bacterium]